MAEMRLDRRTFLQQAGLSLFAMGVSEAGVISLQENNRLAPAVKNYLQTLAASTNRKLALLVGINKYPQQNLSGCLTDLELQKELLINRFGFNPQDIMFLSDRAATRENIETAFVEHLGQQAQTDDVVLFHFSGYGSQVKMPLTVDGVAASDLVEGDTYKLVNSLVPADGVFSTKTASAGNDLLEDTLLLLAQSLNTNKLTIVLDTSFNNSPQQLRGNFKIRSVAEFAEYPNSQELAFRQQLQSKFAEQGLKPSKRLLSIPGVVLSAAGKNQVAAEGQWDGFSAGLFSYALTQYLWQITPSSKVQVALQRTAETVEQVMGRQQQPTINSTDKPPIAYYMTVGDSASAEGVVSAIAPNSLELKLIGFPATILNSYGTNSCVNLVSNSNLDNLIPLQIKSRDGFIAKAQPLDRERLTTIQVGQLVKESIRILNRNLGLTLAVEPNFERIERVDATSAIANVSAITSVVMAGEQNADCLLGKIINSAPETETPTPSYGLFSVGGVSIAKTSGASNEAVKSAIARLNPQFNNLLAAKWLELTSNEFSSGLSVGATLELIDRDRVSFLQRITLSSPPAESSSKAEPLPVEANSFVPALTNGSHIRFSLTNQSDRPLYAMLFGIDADSNVFALYTALESATETANPKLQDIAIAPQTELLVPKSEESWKWKVSELPGITTVYTIFSTQPFRQTLTNLATQQNLQLDREQVLNIPQPLTAITAILSDLHAASSVASDVIGSNTEVYALDVRNWATLNFVYEVVTS
jgi:hypothetical protein